jgi:hypothetical protein
VLADEEPDSRPSAVVVVAVVGMLFAGATAALNLFRLLIPVLFSASPLAAGGVEMDVEPGVLQVRALINLLLTGALFVGCAGSLRLINWARRTVIAAAAGMIVSGGWGIIVIITSGIETHATLTDDMKPLMLAAIIFGAGLSALIQVIPSAMIYALTRPAIRLAFKPATGVQDG